MPISKEIDMKKIKQNKEISKKTDIAKLCIDMSGVLMVALDKDGIVTFVNKKGCEILKSKKNDIIGKNWFNTFLPKRIRSEVKNVFTSLMKGNVKVAEYFENVVLTTEGEERTILWHNTCIKNSKEKIVGTFASGADITVQRKLQEKLESGERRFRSIFENSPISMWESDIAELRNYISSLKSKGVKDFREYFNAHPEDVAHCATMVKPVALNNATLKLFKIKNVKDFWGGLSKIFTKESYHSFIEELLSIANGKNGFEYNATVKTLLDESLRVHVKGIYLPDRENTAIVSIEDVTGIEESRNKLEALNRELTRSNKKLALLVLRDSQTGLYNLRYLIEIIESEFYRAKRHIQPLSLIMFDIDYFKSINDVYGHSFGDLILKQFAKQLQRMLRKHDIVIRSGGEEFIVLCPKTDLTGAYDLTKRTVDALTLHNFGTKDSFVKIKVSAAVCSYPENPVGKAMDLVAKAEKILERAKQDGGARTYRISDTNGEANEHKIPPKLDIGFLEKKIEKLNKKSHQSLSEAIFAFAKTIELKDHYTGEHVERTVRYATKIAENMNLSQEDIERIRRAAILHDLGKVGITEKILHKKSALSKSEMQEIKRHPQIGVDIIRPIRHLHDVIPLILGHHERWDGKGYPAKLKGEEIPLGARIIAVADVYQALTSNRPYRKAFSGKQAVAIIKKGAGIKYDPQVVDAFLKVL